MAITTVILVIPLMKQGRGWALLAGPGAVGCVS